MSLKLILVIVTIFVACQTGGAKAKHSNVEPPKSGSSSIHILQCTKFQMYMWKCKKKVFLPFNDIYITRNPSSRRENRAMPL